MNFGDSALATEVKDLKRQLFQKDSNISSVQNELFKLKEHLGDAERARADALYQLGLEAERRVKADEQLTTAQAELKSFRLRLSNADAALSLAQQQASTALKSAQRDASQSAESGVAGQHAADRLQAEKTKLEARVKALEREAAELRDKQAAAAGPSVRSGLPVAASRLPQSKTRRRSSSTSTFSTGPPPPSAAASAASATELEAMRAKLSRATHELLLAQNAQNAAERAVVRERKAAEEVLDGVKDELERVGWEKAELEAGLKAARQAGSAGQGADAFAAERGELKGKMGVLEGRVKALQGTLEAKEAELKHLSTSSTNEIATLKSSLTTAQSDLAALRLELSTAQSDLSTARSTLASHDASAAEGSATVDELKVALERAEKLAGEAQSRAGGLEKEVEEAKTIAFGAAQEKEALVERIRALEREVRDAGEAEEQKRDLESRLAALQTTLAAAESNVRDAQAASSDLQDQLDASQSACLDAEGEITRLAAALADRPLTASDAADLQAKLDQATLEVSSLQETVRSLEAELARTEEGHRGVVEALREGAEGSAAEAADVLRAVEAQLAGKDRALAKLSARLAQKDDEVRELSRALLTPAPDEKLAAGEESVSEVSGEGKRQADGSLTLTKDEADGVARMEGAIERLRAERDDLRSERADLLRSIQFSEAETRAAEVHIASLAQSLSDEQQEHAALQLISSDTLTLAESLQAQLDIARPAITELEALRDELFGSLEASDARVGEAQRAEEVARESARALQAELDAIKHRVEAVERELAEAVEARDQAVRDRDAKAAALARAIEEQEAAIKDSLADSSAKLQQATLEKDSALEQVADKEAALAAALAAAATAATVVFAPSDTTLEAPARSIPAAEDTPTVPPSPAVDVAALVKEKEALEARIQRRNASIEKQQHDLAKLNTKHALLTDSFDDLETDLAELTAEKEALTAQVAQHLSVQATLTADLNDARSSIQRLETAVAVASTAGSSDYSDEQVAALVGVLFSQRAAQRDLSPSTTVERDSTAQDLLAATAARLESTVDELSAARERSLALEAQLAQEDAQLRALLETTTARLEAVEVELSSTVARSSSGTAALERANTALAGRLDATTASLNARAIEVLSARSSIRSLLSELEANAAGLTSMGEEAGSLRSKEAEHLAALESARAELQSSSVQLTAVQDDALAAQAKLKEENEALQSQLYTARAELAVKIAATTSPTSSIEAKEVEPTPAGAPDADAEIARLTAVVAGMSAALAEKAAPARSVKDADLHAHELSLASEAKAALELQVESLQVELREIQTARDLLESDQVTLKDEIATLKSALASASAVTGEPSVDDAPADDFALAQTQFEESEMKHAAALDLLKEAEDAIASLQAQLAASEVALSSMKSATDGPQDVTDLVSRLADSEAAHQALIAAHETTIASLAASRQSEVALHEEAASRRAQLDDVLEGLSKLQQDHASILQAKSIAEGHVAQIVASKEDVVRQLQDDHAKALALAERAKATKAEQVVELERELSAAKASLSEAIARSEVQDGQIESQAEDLARLQQEIQSAKEAVTAGAARLSATEDTIRQLKSEEATAMADLEAIRVTLTEQTSVIQERDRLHTETMQKIDRLQAHISNVETKLDAAELRLGRQKSRHDDEIAALERSLAEASAASGAPTEGSVEEKIADLEDHVERLIASLDQKNVEVEEADDKIISMLKEKKKFERKIELLQKKLDKATAAAPAAPAPPAVAAAPIPVARAPLSPLNPSASVFVSPSPPLATVTSSVAPPQVKPVNMFATPSVPSHAPSSSVSSSQHGFTPVSHRPIASCRRVSADRAMGSPGTPRSRIASAPVVASPRAQAVFQPSTSENVPPLAAPSSVGTKRSRPADLEQIGPSTVTAICAPAPSPAAMSTILAPSSGNTPRRAPLLTRRAEKGFTPKRSADATARAALLAEKRDAGGPGAAVASRLGGLTLGKEGLQQSTGGLKTSTGDLMSRLAAMRR